MSDSIDWDLSEEPGNELAKGAPADDMVEGGRTDQCARQRLAWYKRAVFIAVTFAMAIIALELSLNVLCLLSDSAAAMLATGERYPPVADAVLGRRPNPEHPEHDASGFRNERVLNTASIVALGDSQTYGTGVTRSQAWPQQLAKRNGLPTYSMAFGGYGPTQSLALFDRAVSLKPRIIVEAFYTGNDLWDCFNMVYHRLQFVDMKSDDEQVLSEIRRLEGQQSVWHKFEPAKGRSVGKGPVRLLASKYLKIYGLLGAVKRATYDRLWSTNRQGALSSGGRQIAFDVPPFRTVFAPVRRTTALDPRDARIREGHRLAIEAIRSMKTRATKAGIEFAVLLIPTKELVFREIARSDPEVMPDTYWSLIRIERDVLERTKVLLEREGIDVVDALPALQQCVKDGRQPYPVSDDGHPNATGQAAIADAVHSALRRFGILPQAIP
ncbi:MAG: hypothetical protein ACE5E5_15395 [Phycisphaerae bacterium]